MKQEDADALDELVARYGPHMVKAMWNDAHNRTEQLRKTKKLERKLLPLLATAIEWRFNLLDNPPQVLVVMFEFKDNIENFCLFMQRRDNYFDTVALYELRSLQQFTTGTTVVLLVPRSSYEVGVLPPNMQRMLLKDYL